MCDRYDELYEKRNHLVHSVRRGSGDLDQMSTATLMPRHRKGAPLTDVSSMVVERRMGVPELIDLWYVIDELRRELLDVVLWRRDRRSDDL
jgi:hypothetical protein